MDLAVGAAHLARSEEIAGFDVGQRAFLDAVDCGAPSRGLTVRLRPSSLPTVPTTRIGVVSGGVCAADDAAASAANAAMNSWNGRIGRRLLCVEPPRAR
jgi:hypothetical protein